MSDSVQPAEWQWKHYFQSIVIPTTDILFNSGPGQVLDLIKLKEEVAMASLLQKLSRAVYKVSPQNTAIDLDNLVDAVTSTTNTYGGIARTGNTFWQPATPTNLGANLSLSAMQTQYGLATFGNEEPDTILTTQAGYNAFWNLLVGDIRYIRDDETTRMGFRNHLVFNNAVALHDFFVPAGDMFFLNTKYIVVYFLDKDYFVIDPFVKPSNQRVIVSGIYVTLNVVVKNPRMQTVITNITNA